MRHLSLVLTASCLLTACPDPGEGKAKAKVTDKASDAVDATKPAVDGTKPAGAAVPAGALPFAASSSLEFIGAKITGKHEGGFKAFTGHFVLDGNMPKSVSTSIDMSSVFTDAKKLTGHLMSPDFFNIAKHPKTTFVTTKIEEGGDGGATHVLTGDLTLVGKTKSIQFPVTFKMSKTEVAMTADFAINRKDFDIVYPGKPDDLIADNVNIKLNVTAPKAVK